MITFRLIVVASALASASIVGADSLAATRIESAREASAVAKTFADRLPQASVGTPVAVSRTVGGQPASRRSEERPAPRTCPERSWPYGAARCVAQAPAVRVIALDAVAADRPALREAL
jgi:hypothetical protein